MCIPCILIPVITGLICALLGYLSGKLFGNKKSTECDDLRIELGDYKAKLDACKANSEKLQLSLNELKANSKLNIAAAAPAAEKLFSFDENLAASIFGKKVVLDDLKMIEGIGPKIEELFHAAGIKTWKKLSETSVEKCREILSQGGEHFQLHDPETWPKQSELAFQGKWKELKDWQEKLDAGRK